MMQIALYKGRRSQNSSAKLFDWLICWWTRGPYSHAELVLIPPGDLVLVPPGDPAHNSYCASSSIRDGGVRFKLMRLSSEKWRVIGVPAKPEALFAAAMWFEQHYAAKYDWLGILGFVVHKRWGRGNKWFCSEAVAAALGLADTNVSPNDLARMFGALEGQT